jgi:hypothetical protein
MLRTEIRKVSRGILSSSIISQSFNISFELVLNLCLINFKIVERFIFSFQQVYLAVTCCIVNKSKTISFSSFSQNTIISHKSV